MLLSQNGNRVQGTYGNSGKIDGTVSGNVLTGTYWWQNKTGTFELTMSADGMSFTGKWSRSGASGAWSGRKVVEGEPPGGSSTDNDSPGSDDSGDNPTKRVLDLGDGLTQYTIWSADQDAPGGPSGQQLIMGRHTYCALTYVMSGGFNSACAVVVRGRDWILIARDPGKPDAYTGESQGCSAICFDR